MSTGTEALNMVIAAFAVGMISGDPELIGRLRKYAESKDAPFDPEDINPTLLSMAEMDVLERGRIVLEGEPERPHQPHAHAVIPIPRVAGAAAGSAEALGVGSFTTEYVHASDDVFEAFCAWMSEAHPSALREGQDIKREQVVRADQLLTTMAAVAGKIADAREGA